MLAKVAVNGQLTIGNPQRQSAIRNWQSAINDLTMAQGHSLLITHYSLFITPSIFTKIYAMESKGSSESLTMMTEIVLPNDTNVFGNLMGGRLMYWMDIAAAIAAQKHCNAPVVTASVDNISFESAIKLGNTVHIQANVTRAFNTSMEVHLKVWGEDHIQQYKYKSN